MVNKKEAGEYSNQLRALQPTVGYGTLCLGQMPSQSLPQTQHQKLGYESLLI